MTAEIATEAPTFRWCPQVPTPKQHAFVLLGNIEALYGGQAGGGKSSALLMAALRYVDVPGYAALLLRRTYADLSLPGALMDRAHDWLAPTAAHWSDISKTWTFPSGATISFGYLETERHKYRYQSAEFQFIAFDELTQFPESSYTYLFSRLRRPKGIKVPVRVRAGSNPGGEGHAWVYERFVVPHRKPGRLFLPAGLDDNPYVDAEQYRLALAELDDVTRAQLLDGLWVTDPTRKAFDRAWWRNRYRFHIDHMRDNARVIGRWCSWDTAMKDTESSAYSACVVVELLDDYRVRVREVYREKLQFPDLPTAIETIAARWNRDGKLKGVIIEDKASGTSAYQTLVRSAPEWLANILHAYMPKSYANIDSKVGRAKQAAVWCKRGMVWLPYPVEATAWLYDFENEIFTFPDSVYKDQTDAFSQAVLYLENYIATGWAALKALQEPDAEGEAD